MESGCGFGKSDGSSKAGGSVVTVETGASTVAVAVRVDVDGWGGSCGDVIAKVGKAGCQANPDGHIGTMKFVRVASGPVVGRRKADIVANRGW